MTRVDFALPDVGEGLDEAEVVRWLVGEGEQAARDQPVVEIETSKSIVELPAPGTGTMVSHAAAEGDIVPVGGLLFVFETDAPATTPAAQPVRAPDPSPQAAGMPADPDRGADVRAATRPLASPSTRQRARDAGVDLAAVRGTGPHHRITRQDLEAHLSAASAPGGSGAEPAADPSAAVLPVPTAGTDEVRPLRGLRRQIAKAMTTAWNTVPHITDMREVDATRLVTARQALKNHLALGEVPFTFLPLVIRAVTAALAQVPAFNSSIDTEADTVTVHGRRNIGLATSAPDGLMVPVLKDADQLSLAEIARQVRTLTDRARHRTSTPAELTGGTFTITNFGSYGSWLATPIIRPPEAAILGIGRIQDRVVPVDGEPAIRPVLTLCVSADHRIIDGEDMGLFLGALGRYLSDPILLLDGA
ncbi:dienelactone hydrolase [Nakamurella sp. YIM 132087]|uniref:Dihydrolipoamide acetyltransferase component of pyruvate dehydrogenase complex n=1 Tax=Nakamurella alba TaxID=2665158 RepID=A0A7K1FEP4_9ACTN|nr:dihydrolipoamide acetyltransferase family protein [Nakamurella alba]MTD12546.1 dienelactone hydrolase [Nakamurella alba]